MQSLHNIHDLGNGTRVCGVYGTEYTGQYIVRCSVAQLYLTLRKPWTVAWKAPLSVGYPRQE